MGNKGRWKEKTNGMTKESIRGEDNNRHTGRTEGKD